MIFPDPSHRVDLALIYNHVLSEIRTPITSQESRMLLVHMLISATTFNHSSPHAGFRVVGPTLQPLWRLASIAT
ncbi:hypothetical protein H9L39_01513 [Fusarium oxysporum f. sp. albedinis]|nr:hypothetical protein H9L39_01513 [Fusarium oxysporum f. sp. albedinis]